jgi:hypothetical protein
VIVGPDRFVVIIPTELESFDDIVGKRRLEFDMGASVCGCNLEFVTLPAPVSDPLRELLCTSLRFIDIVADVAELRLLFDTCVSVEFEWAGDTVLSVLFVLGVVTSLPGFVIVFIGAEYDIAIHVGQGILKVIVPKVFSDVEGSI